MKNMAWLSGLEAWSQLVVRHNPYTKGNAITKLTETLRWDSGAESEFHDKLGSRLQQCLPSEHRKHCLKHVRFKADKLDTNKKFKKRAVDNVVNQSTGPVPMDVGALLKGKGKLDGQQQRVQRKPRTRPRTTRATARRRAKVTRRHNQGTLKANCRYMLEMGSQVEGLLATRKGSAGEQGERGRRQGRTPNFDRSRKQHSTQPRDLFKHSDSSVRTHHGAKCPTMLRRAGFFTLEAGRYPGLQGDDWPDSWWRCGRDDDRRHGTDDSWVYCTSLGRQWKHRAGVVS